jgi:hypothetical protein
MEGGGSVVRGGRWTMDGMDFMDGNGRDGRNGPYGRKWTTPNGQTQMDSFNWTTPNGRVVIIAFHVSLYEMRK